ncbi:MAG TPA: hypothetical protein VJW77_15975 [Terriglobia bacterium]|nr:hypothetical protein [Terriglobia bacterium]
MTIASAYYGVDEAPIRVLAARPLRSREGGCATELFGDYDPQTWLIRVWMRTAIRKQVTSFGTFLSTLCHKFCHHMLGIPMEREIQLGGSKRRKNIVIGTLEEFPNESAAQAAVDAVRLEINRQTPQQVLKNISLETLVNHYRQHELPDVFGKCKPTPDVAQEERKSYATQVTYDGYLRKWIVPR